MIADPAVRNRGTIGGSLCQADPGEDLSAVATALRAAVVIRGSEGERAIRWTEFHVGPYMTAVKDAEMLTEIRLPHAPGRGHRAREARTPGRRLRDRRRVSRPWVDGGLYHRRGVAFAAVGPFTIDAKRAQEHLIGKAPVSRSSARRQRSLPRTRCRSDSRGPEDYKRHLTGVLTKRALIRAAGARCTRRHSVEVTININGQPVTP